MLRAVFATPNASLNVLSAILDSVDASERLAFRIPYNERSEMSLSLEFAGRAMTRDAQSLQQATRHHHYVTAQTLIEATGRFLEGQRTLLYLQALLNRRCFRIGNFASPICMQFQGIKIGVRIT